MDCERDRSFDFPLIERERLMESDWDLLWLIERCSLILLTLCERLCETDISILRERD